MASVNALLDFIGAEESRNDFNAVWNRIRAADRPKRPLVGMTVREVLAWQDSIDHKYMSEAAGAYQFLEDTLRGLYAEAGVSLDDRFDERTQRKLAVQLLKRRGLNRYMRGEISAVEFCNNLAREWASLPVVSGPKRGRSYYDGDGLNKALVDVEPFVKIVESLREKGVAPTVKPPAPAGGFWARLIAMLFGGGK